MPATTSSREAIGIVLDVGFYLGRTAKAAEMHQAGPVHHAPQSQIDAHESFRSITDAQALLNTASARKASHKTGRMNMGSKGH